MGDCRRLASIIAAACVLAATVAAADPWNDKTTLRFTAPVMVPGATLPPATYTFKLLDMKATRNVVQILNEDETRVITTALTVPAQRTDPAGDVVLQLNPTTGGGAPAAVKAWFYPGSRFGHEFVYPDEQARQIAQRTRTVVLSADARDRDMEAATIYTYDAEGRKGAWRADERLTAEWRRWNEDGRRTATARLGGPAPDTSDTPEATAAMVTRTRLEGMPVKLGDLEEHPNKYVGQQIRVTAEVEDVFGPRLFKIDEPNWADLDGEVLVYLPANFAALVREGDRVTVVGTLRTLDKGELDRELAWLDPEPDRTLQLATRPVLMASQVVSAGRSR